ncbi:MAG TPA: hypothetical protein PKM43_17585 [Verrucomicrobiota bacterium]|nr:hypothetical protein [Verrucomicrobiota bacterium]HRZ57367.1 hypothetical protein [Candidatus Paceibacterota bacterium]
MSISKTAGCALCVVLVVLLPACQNLQSPSSQRPVDAPPELLQPSYLYEVVRHLYRWHLNESEVERIVGAKRFVFWARRLEARLDAGDRSVLGEILLPQLDLRVKVKKSDYTIEELGTEVKSQNFRITQVIRGQMPIRPPQSCAVVEVDMQEMRDYLFRTRNQRDEPDAALIERLRTAVREQAAKEGLLPTGTPAEEQIVHMAPLSPVANETWVFWEAGRKLLHFASDIDLANPAVWQHQTLMARIFDLDQQVVVTHEEAPGSNRFLTRYQVSRALFNCVVLGHRIVVPPYQPQTGATPGVPPP